MRDKFKAFSTRHHPPPLIETQETQIAPISFFYFLLFLVFFVLVFFCVIFAFVFSAYTLQI